MNHEEIDRGLSDDRAIEEARRFFGEQWTVDNIRLRQQIYSLTHKTRLWKKIVLILVAKLGVHD